MWKTQELYSKHENKFSSIEDCFNFITAGNAIFTLVSVRTQKRFTFKVSKSTKTEGLLVRVLTSNNDFYSPLCAISLPDLKLYGKNFKLYGANCPSFKAFEWFWKGLMRSKVYGKIESALPPSLVEVWHEGQCGRCGRRLTVPESIKSGIGPECAGKMLSERNLKELF